MDTNERSATRWRDQPVIPAAADYQDIASLVKLARKARRRIVEFEWVFTREDVLSLRRAVCEGSAWSSVATSASMLGCELCLRRPGTGPRPSDKGFTSTRPGRPR